MNKKIFALFLVLVFLFSSVPAFAAENETIQIYFFWSDGCSHCKAEEAFLETLPEKYDVEIHSLEVTGNATNRELLMLVGENLGVSVTGVPFTVIGNHHVPGWRGEEISGTLIEDAINHVMANDCPDIVEELTCELQPAETELPEVITLPLFGEVAVKDVSLPVFTVMVAALDGFNPCAMWVLLFLISLLIGMEDKKKIWIFGSIFIAASAFVYFLFLSAWLNIFLFLGLVFWVRIVIAIVALYAGYYNLKEYVTNPEGVCKITEGERRQKIFKKLRGLVEEKTFWLAVAGIILLAFAVNLVELICSVGLPAVYTNVLTLSNLPVWQYYAYLLLYVFIFMLDDMFVFYIAIKTLQVSGISTKYVRMSHLIGGIIMLLVGILLIFAPHLLAFG